MTHPDQSVDGFYKVPVIALTSLGDFQPTVTDPERIYTVPIGDGMILAFLVNPRRAPAGDLRVGFHAAKGAGQTKGYRFAPLSICRASGSPFVLFADPTLTLAPYNVLSWYVGTADVDPDDAMETIIRRLMVASAAPYVLFEGSSGGGFVSMRLSARFSNSVAVPRIPQTDIFRYAATAPITQTLKTAWNGLTHAEILENYAHRFRIADLYTDPGWNRGNLITYVHNTGDVRHTQDHLTPFLQELGLRSTAYAAMNYRIIIQRIYVGKGHIGIPSDFWPAEANLALARLKKLKPDAEADEPMFVKPLEFSRKPETEEKRAEFIALHFKDF